MKSKVNLLTITIVKTVVETQVSMGVYRPYRKTLYWTCCSTATFAIFAFSHISRFHASHIFHAFCISDTSRFRASHILRTFHDPTQFAFCVLTYLAHFVFSHISHFAFSHSRIFRALTRATAHLPRIHRIPFACPVLILQGPLVRISLCFTCITSYMSLHSHLCSLISLCVYITSPLYV
jgi:hypothetical protein